MNKIHLIGTLSALLLWALLASACDSEKSGTHDLTVQWNISGLAVCSAYLPAAQYAQEDVHFGTVEINIYDNEKAETAVREPMVVPCDEHHRTIEGLERGSYFVTIDAFADYAGEELPFFRGESKVSIPAEGNFIDIPLAVGDGNIQVTWQFAGGRICGLEKIGEVSSIAITLEGGDVDIEVPCGEGQVLLDDIYPYNDYRITAAALDKNGDVLYHARLAANPFEVLPGQSFAADLVFQ